MKPFDPVEEVRLLRRRLALRMQTCEQPDGLPIVQPEIETLKVASPSLLQTEPFSLEKIVAKVRETKKALAVWQRFQLRRKTPPITVFRGPIFRAPIFHGDWQFRREKRSPSVATHSLTTPHLMTPCEGTLETINAGLTALGIVGIVFGILSFSQGWTNDLSLGLQVSLSGLTVMVVGLSGRFLSSRVDSSVP